MARQSGKTRYSGLPMVCVVLFISACVFGVSLSVPSQAYASESIDMHSGTLLLDRSEFRPNIIGKTPVNIKVNGKLIRNDGTYGNAHVANAQRTSGGDGRTNMAIAFYYDGKSGTDGGEPHQLEAYENPTGDENITTTQMIGNVLDNLPSRSTLQRLMSGVTIGWDYDNVTDTPYNGREVSLHVELSDITMGEAKNSHNNDAIFFNADDTPANCAWGKSGWVNFYFGEKSDPSQAIWLAGAESATITYTYFYNDGNFDHVAIDPSDYISVSTSSLDADRGGVEFSLYTRDQVINAYYNGGYIVNGEVNASTNPLFANALARCESGNTYRNSDQSGYFTFYGTYPDIHRYQETGMKYPGAIPAWRPGDNGDYLKNVISQPGSYQTVQSSAGATFKNNGFHYIIGDTMQGIGFSVNSMPITSQKPDTPSKAITLDDGSPTLASSTDTYRNLTYTVTQPLTEEGVTAASGYRFKDIDFSDVLPDGMTFHRLAVYNGETLAYAYATDGSQPLDQRGNGAGMLAIDGQKIWFCFGDGYLENMALSGQSLRFVIDGTVNVEGAYDSATISQLVLNNQAITNFNESYRQTTNQVTTTVNTGHLNVLKTTTEKIPPYAAQNYGLGGAQFTIYRDAACTNAIETVTVSGDSASATATGDKFYVAGETFYCKETTAPTNYYANEAVYSAVAAANGTVTFNAGTGFADAPEKGKLSLSKSSSIKPMTDVNHSYTLSGAIYGIYSDAACTNLVMQVTTDMGGSAVSGDLLAADYYVKEIHASDGYALDPTVHDAHVTALQTTPINDNDGVKEVPRSDFDADGGVLLHKVDKETGSSTPSGDAMLSDASYTVKYYDGYYDSAANATMSGRPTRTWVFKTDANGALMFDEAHFMSGDALYKNSAGKMTLPLGTYTLIETTAPVGYLPDTTTYSAQVTEDTKTIEFTNTYSAPTSPEQVKRGDLSFVKDELDKAKRLPNCVFRLTSNTTGESHIIVTDENGQFNSAATWNAHTQNTNGNDKAVSADGTVNEALLDHYAGIWFYGSAVNISNKATDSLCALPYDTYAIQELRCAANQGLELVKTQFSIRRNATPVDIGTIDDLFTDYVIDKNLVSVDGNKAEYAITVENIGSTVLANVRLSDSFDNLTYVGCAGAGYSNGTFNVTKIGIGQSVAVRAFYTIDDMTKTFTNAVVATDHADGYALDKVRVASATDMTPANGEVAVGDTLYYLVTATNTSSAPVRPIITDKPFDGLTIINAQTACGEAELNHGGTLTWTATSIEAGESATLLITSKVDAKATGRITNKAYDDHHVTVVTDPLPLLSLVKTADPVDGSEVNAGSVISYTLELRNDSGAEVNDITVFDAIPPNTSYEQFSVSPDYDGTFDSDANALGWIVPRIEAGGYARMQFAVKTDDHASGIDIENVASYETNRSSLPKEPLANASNTVVHHVPGAPPRFIDATAQTAAALFDATGNAIARYAWIVIPIGGVGIFALKKVLDLRKAAKTARLLRRWGCWGR